jgi:hypothetical protein
MKAKSIKIILVVTLVFAFVFFTLAIVGRASDRVVVIIFSVLALLGAATPVFFARRLTNAIRSGRAAVAVVESLQYSRRGARDTLDAIENGIARGTWRVAGLGLVHFEVDESWAPQLSVGSHVQLLIAGAAPTGIFPLGLQP